ncbi:MAG: 5'-3' exonuclease H3TH domain-containing protein [Patescibacteria group bacterium]|jgi:DNA polymerase-1
MEKLVLIDGNAIIHRAYHALPPNMSNSRGELTNAVYGFTTTLIKVLEDLKPEHIACSFDLAGPTFRHEAYSDYKATRVKADQELYDQIPRVKEIVKTMNIPIYEKEGFEADDVVGTIVERLKDDKNIQIYIVSGDKDIYQLINGNVLVYSLRHGLNKLEIVDHATIYEEYNLDPHDFIDLKALAGDPSDNIPGVPGIGPKTATELIQKFDTLDNLYGQIAKLLNCSLNNLTMQQFNNEMVESVAKELKVKPRIIQLLLTNKDQAFLSQKLATIHRDVPIDFSLEDAKWGDYDRDKLKALFEELGFRSLLARFGVAEAKQGRKPTEEQKKKDEQLKLL